MSLSVEIVLFKVFIKQGVNMKATNPRHGSMQFWPRKRASRHYPRVRSWANAKDVKLLGFAGYKVGMTQVQYVDGKKLSPTKGMDVVSPVTIVECPPLKVFGARAYQKSFYGDNVIAESFSKKDKYLSLKLTANEKKKSKVSTLDKVDAKDLSRVMLVCYTQPSQSNVGKKKPELFEVALGGSVEEQLAYANENLGKEIAVSDVFGAGDMVDIHAVTTGKGYQGVIKRFGVALRVAKSEKGQRRVGARSGGWTSQAHMMYRVAQPGQMGYHTRTEYNKKIMLVESDPEKIAIKGGIRSYGNVKNTYLLIYGSIPGPKKRLIRLTKAIRPKKDKIGTPTIDYVSLESQQS